MKEDARISGISYIFYTTSVGFMKIRSVDVA